MSTLASPADELRALVAQAWELRESPYLVDACRAIEDWHDRRYLRAFERRQEHLARLLQLMRETNPVPARAEAA